MKAEAVIMERETMDYWGTTIDMRAAHESLAKMYGVPLLRPDEVSAFIGLSGGSVLDCEKDFTPRVSSTNVVTGQAYNYPPSRQLAVYHYDWPSGKSWLEYTDGTKAPFPEKKENESDGGITAIGEAGRTPKWNKRQMKGGAGG
jgi:hypothetical protein